MSTLTRTDFHDSVFEHIDEDACRLFQSSVELIGRRWSPGIMLALSRSATRFSEILAAVPGLSDRMLSQRLKELEKTGLVVREVLATTPVQVHYTLTERGADLMDSMQPIVAWGVRWES